MYFQENILFDPRPLGIGHIIEMLPSTLIIMWAIRLQSLKVLCPRTKEEMHLQNKLFDLWSSPLGQGHTKCCPVPSTSCGLCTCKVWNCYIQWLRRRCIYKKIYNLTFDLDAKVKVIQNCAQFPLHHVFYAPAKLKVSMSNGLGGDAEWLWYEINIPFL